MIDTLPQYALIGSDFIIPTRDERNVLVLMIRSHNLVPDSWLVDSEPVIIIRGQNLDSDSLFFIFSFHGKLQIFVLL